MTLCIVSCLSFAFQWDLCKVVFRRLDIASNIHLKDIFAALDGHLLRQTLFRAIAGGLEWRHASRALEESIGWGYLASEH